MRKARQESVAAGRIDNDHIADRRKALQRVFKTARFLGFGLIQASMRTRIHADHIRHREAGACRLNPPIAVLEVAGERALAHIQVDRADPFALAQQGNTKMHRDGRLARTAFLIADRDDAAGTRRRIIHVRAVRMRGSNGPEAISSHYSPFQIAQLY